MDWKRDKLYQKYLKAGYREWESEAQMKLKGTPYFVQKSYYEAGYTLFFITVFVFIDEEGNVLFQPEIHFNTKDKKYFEITVVEDDITPEWLEKFCLQLFRQMECLPYGKKDS